MRRRGGGCLATTPSKIYDRRGQQYHFCAACTIVDGGELMDSPLLLEDDKTNEL